MLFWVIYSVYGIYFKTIPITRDLLLHTTILFSMMIHKANIFHFVLLNFSCRSFLNIFLFCILPLTSGLSASPGNLDLFTKSPQTWEALLIWNFIFYNFFKNLKTTFLSVYTPEKLFEQRWDKYLKAKSLMTLTQPEGCLPSLEGHSSQKSTHCIWLKPINDWCRSSIWLMIKQSDKRWMFSPSAECLFYIFSTSGFLALLFIQSSVQQTFMKSTLFARCK